MTAGRQVKKHQALVAAAVEVVMAAAVVSIALSIAVAEDKQGSPNTRQLHQIQLPRIHLTANVIKPVCSIRKGGSVAEWSACWTRAQKGLGSNCSRDARQTVHTNHACVHHAAKLVAALLMVAGVTAGWWKVMAAYCRVYDSRHLQADCQKLGSASEHYAQSSSMGYLYLYLVSGTDVFRCQCIT